MNLLRHPFNSRGFTLTETMVVVAIIAIMTGFGYSGFSSWIVKERARSAANQFAGHLKEARIRAIEKHTNYVLAYDYSTGNYNMFIDSRDSDTGQYDFTYDSSISEEKEILKIDVGHQFAGTDARDPSSSPSSAFGILFDSKGIPWKKDGSGDPAPCLPDYPILFLSKNATLGTPDCINNDCCRSDIGANGPNCSDGLCCAVCVSYIDIKVVCNDDA